MADDKIFLLSLITFWGRVGENCLPLPFVLAEQTLKCDEDDAVGVCCRRSLLRNFLFSKLLIVLWEMRN